MIHRLLLILAVLLELGLCTAPAQSNDVPLVQRRWFETRTAHFNIYSCGAPQDVYKLSARLEQFCEAYTLLVGGAQAVASPPIVVMAFPDHETMKPFLPLYQGQPANLAAFFQRGSDENLIPAPPAAARPGPARQSGGLLPARERRKPDRACPARHQFGLHRHGSHLSRIHPPAVPAERPHLAALAQGGNGPGLLHLRNDRLQRPHRQTD